MVIRGSRLMRGSPSMRASYYVNITLFAITIFR
jgi:hypothetical protein